MIFKFEFESVEFENAKKKKHMEDAFMQKDRIVGKLRDFAWSVQAPSFAERGIELSVYTPR